MDSLHAIDEDETGDDYEARFSSTIEQVKEIVPSSETVSMNGSEVEVDNTWLSAALDSLAHMRADDKQREVAIDSITERLRALEQQVGTVKATATKDENKGRMASVLRRGEFNEQNKGESALARWSRKFQEWLARLFRRTAPPSSTTVTSVSKVARYVVYGLIGALLLFALWKLLPFVRRHAQSTTLGLKRERVILGERLSADQTAADLLSEAETLVRNGDIRGAIRKGYIAFLCELGDRKIIRIEQHKTNHDYLKSVPSQEPLHRDMQALTGSFEKHWYGSIPATQEDWSLFRTRYGEALAQKAAAERP